MSAAFAHTRITQDGPLQTTFSTTWLAPSVAIISVHGELDAANADEFTGYLDRHTARADKLVIDLSEVRFFAAAALDILVRLDDESSNQAFAWGVIACPTLDRLRQICKLELPSYSSLTTALNGIRHRPTGSVQLVTQPGKRFRQ